ncbi:hypothetical protein TD95_002025 [Thielaviopsis punctulata]|uniref:Zinc/iron permease n=1 Tax=Thielaviopsis punctulata TaxID=72032 RepID=A0A0F4ZBA5_9PEZI|nr:hypothetical protein TD95_002025 [Thielaviopsis punctulata]
MPLANDTSFFPAHIERAYLPAARNSQYDLESGHSHMAIYQVKGLEKTQTKFGPKPKSKVRHYLGVKLCKFWFFAFLLFLLVMCLLYKTLAYPGGHEGHIEASTDSTASGSCVSLNVPSVTADISSVVSTVPASMTVSVLGPVSAASASASAILSMPISVPTVSPLPESNPLTENNPFSGPLLPILLAPSGRIANKHIGHSHGGHSHDDHDHEGHGHDHDECPYEASYNLPLHISAVFILMASSSLPCAIPLLAKNLLTNRASSCIFFAARYIGTGVLMATAFVHLYPTAFSALTHPSLPSFFTETYSCLPGAVTLGAILVVLGVEMVLSPTRVLGTQFTGRCTQDSKSEENNAEAASKFQQVMQCRLLESGIIFHSIFIGMALSVASGPGFMAFMAAIMFHQAFEGLALGSRIAAISWHASSVEPWIMVVLYGLTTPTGQAIGLATRTLYDPKSPAGLLVVGFANAISAGLLAFAALTEIIPEDFLSTHSWKKMCGWRRVLAYGLVVLGAAMMSLIGYWA